MENQMRMMVNFENKNLVKVSGCKWNAEKKYWYCPSSISKENLKKLIEHQKQRKVAFVKRTIDRSLTYWKDNKLHEFDVTGLVIMDFDYRIHVLYVAFSEEEINEWHNHHSYPFDKFEQKVIEPTKKAYFSNTVCNFCKTNKLSKEEILNIESQFKFLDVCNGCKIEYKINKFV